LPASFQTSLSPSALTEESHGKHYFTTDLLSLVDKDRVR
jgi:hypothetical protein